MPVLIQEFQGGTAQVREKLNQLVHAVNALADIPQSAFIKVDRTQNATLISLKLQELLAVIPKQKGGVAGIIKAKVNAIASTSSAPPIVYTLRQGHWDMTGAAPGAWVDDSGGGATELKAYTENSDAVPPLPGQVVDVLVRGLDGSGNPTYSIVGGPGAAAVYLTQNGGADGVASTLTLASWTYDVYLDSGRTVKIGTAVSVVAPRLLPAATTVATRGLAGISGTSVGLLEAYESLTGCTDGGGSLGGGSA